MTESARQRDRLALLLFAGFPEHRARGPWRGWVDEPLTNKRQQLLARGKANVELGERGSRGSDSPETERAGLSELPSACR